jgi:hypothetical protein
MTRILTAVTATAALLVAGAANAGSHPSGAAQTTTSTMGGHPTGGGGRGGPGMPCNYRGSGCGPLSPGHVTGTNKQTCKPNGEGCLRPK